MIKRLLVLSLMAILILSALAACGRDSAPVAAGQDGSGPLDMQIGTLNGNMGVAMAWLMEQAELGIPFDNYSFERRTAPDQLTAALLSGQVQIAALPTNVAATLYNRSEGLIQMIAISAYGVLHILENGEEINAIADLRGRTIHTTGQAANPEFILNHILEQNGLTPGVDVFVQFHQNEALAALMAAGEIDLSMMPEPMVTSVLAQNENVRVALDMTTEWDAVGDGSSLVMSCIVVRRDFAEAHPEAVLRFLDYFRQSVEETVANPAEAAQLIAKFEIIASPAIAERAIPGCNLTFITGADMEPTIRGYFQVLYTANPDAIGGAMPDAAFYFLAE